MNAKLLKRLGLAADAGPEIFEAAVSDLLDRVETLDGQVKELSKLPPETDAAKLEKRISKKIADSGGALSREQAKLAIEHQDAQDAANKKAKK